MVDFFVLLKTNELHAKYQEIFTTFPFRTGVILSLSFRYIMHGS